MRGSSWSLLPLSLLASFASATHYDVTVGKGGKLEFVPLTLTANPGDDITYHFFSKNHSVVQSSFDAPCQPLDGGSFSGFTPTDSQDVESRTTWTITVKDSSPVWIYCAQTNGDHCQKGMVHSINAATTGNKTIDDYKNHAASAPTSKSPADGLPVSGALNGVRRLHVDVGLGGNLTFTPNNITELPRTVVSFSFNPKNHSVVQSTFQDPCHPMSNGFFSLFVPTTQSPSGAVFDFVIPDFTPVWFYCAQTTGSHCQKGMVGSINAKTTGNTLEAFIGLAAKASNSTAPPTGPLGGHLFLNGKDVGSVSGNVFTGAPGGSGTAPPPPPATTTAGGSPPPATNAPPPPPGGNVSDQWMGMAGGGTPNNYNWAPTISDNATTFLLILQFTDDVMIDILIDGYNKINAGGAWAGAWPKTIVDTFGAMAGQALVHRTAVTDSLGHYSKQNLGVCTYKSPNDNIDHFLDALTKVLLLEIALLIDIIAVVAVSDPWLVPVLASEIGTKSRMHGVVNMMQNHMAAAAPREAMLPAEMVWHYSMQHWVSSCPDAIPGMPQNAWPALNWASTKTADGTATGALTVVVITIDPSWPKTLFIAWIGAWGNIEFTDVRADGSSDVPADMHGYAWSLLVSQKGGKLADLVAVAVAGPHSDWLGKW